MKPRTRIAVAVVVLLVGWALAFPFRTSRNAPVSRKQSRGAPQLNIRRTQSTRSATPESFSAVPAPDDTGARPLADAASISPPKRVFPPAPAPVTSPANPAPVLLRVDGAQTNAAHFDGINGVEPLPASHGPTDSAPGGYLDAGDARSVRMHRVVNGDTLPKLARTYLGDADLYLVIYEANRRVLWSPYILPIGVELRIPASARRLLKK